MKIGLDIMGGDFAPQATVLGAIAAFEVLKPDQKVVLIGDKNIAEGILHENNFDPGNFEFVHTTQVIEMGEHPAKAVVQKPDSSISVGFKLLKEGAIDAFASVGNSGAMLVGAMFSVKVIPGVLRPAITSIIPQLSGARGVLVDAGANADCKPEFMLQFGILGSLYAQHVYHIENPRVALMNIGEEEEKGNVLYQASHPLLKECEQINFVGNVEGRKAFYDFADVIVADGFTGNVILKLSESFYEISVEKKIKDHFFDMFNYEQYGGSPVLGVNAPVLIGHGISKAEAIKNIVLASRDMVASGLVEKIRAAFQQ
jgi:glycerol-3-phosphate acyltransferase PlsX